LIGVTTAVAWLELAVGSSLTVTLWMASTFPSMTRSMAFSIAYSMALSMAESSAGGTR